MSDISVDNNNKKKALGRGLGSLLGGPAPSAQELPTKPAPQATTQSATVSTQVTTQSPAAVAAPVDPESKIWQVSIERLQSGQYQPRQTFEKTALQELAQSIKENGILQPITARRISSGKLEIIAGERRWRAAQLAGLKEVPVILKSYDDKQALELAIVENVQREDLNPIEEAEAYSRLIQEFNLSQQQVADKVGKERASVANAIRLLGLTEKVKNLVAEGLLAVGHA